ncbi:helix-turn-helix DNA binding domain protein [Microbacterium phage Pickles13]|nr:helix-turn-helix DNA binding domain protein [Microbacterium phage Pickles13]
MVGMTETKTAAPTYLTLADIARVIGVGIDSMRVYHQRASRNRRAGETKPGDLPAPDETFGRSPVWSSDTVTEWIASRPGRGAGGGRPPRAE